jgi:hypothetical protein
VAVNCWLVLIDIEEDVGEITIELKFATAKVTVKLAVDCMDPD